MKKLISYFLIITMLLMVGCSKKNESGEKPVEESPAVSEEVVQEVTNEYCEMMNTDTRPVAVMIDNDVAASRPQIGLESAYMVYEIIVEGGASRMMALFKNHDVEKVGPIRSSRHYFLDYALEHDAIYCHAGWSPKASADIKSLGVNNINGIQGDDGSVYWRDYTYDRTWHNLYSGVDKLYDKAVNTKKYRGTTDVSHNPYSNEDIVPETDSAATEIKLPYSTFYRVGYIYDADNMVYKRYVDGKEHMSQTGDVLTAKNIIVYKVRNFNLNDGDNVGRQDIENIGSGSGYYITNGKVVDIKWSKKSRTGKTIYTTEDGEELVLNPGNTFVQIMPVSSTITIS